jgi:enoyl-CoA hydratase/carnithine racemase
VHLPRQISRHKAFELLFGRKPISAHEAVSLGIINHAVPRDELTKRAFAMAQMFAAKSPSIMALGWQSFTRATTSTTGAMWKVKSRPCATSSIRLMGERDCRHFSKSANRTGRDGGQIRACVLLRQRTAA